MKKKFSKVLMLVAVVMATMFSSCITFKPIYGVSSGFLDYSKYTDNGFFLTESSAVGFEYTAVGSIVVRLKDGYVTVNEEVIDIKRSVKGNKEKVKITEEWKNANMNDLLEHAVELAKEKGGNGIINLQSEPTYTYINNKRYHDGYILTGMVIKR